MNQIKEKITEIAEKVAHDLGFLLIEVSLKGDNRNRIIEIFIDSDKGVTIDNCALMSHEVGDIIEASDLLSSNYRLDVSSPGVDRPLKFLAQFPQHLHRKFEVVYQDRDEEENLSGQEDGKPVEKKLTGKLILIEDEALTFRVNNKDIKINFSNIKTAKVLISF